MPTKSVAKFLSGKNSSLNTLIERAQHLQKLTRILQNVLQNISHDANAAQLAKHVTFSNLRDDTAVISTDTPAWLTQLRYQAPIILQHLKQQPGLQGLRKIQFKIQPSSQAPILKPARRAMLSNYSAEVLRSAADGTDDTELADALRRLSQQKLTNAK